MQNLDKRPKQVVIYILSGPHSLPFITPSKSIPILGHCSTPILILGDCSIPIPNTQYVTGTGKGILAHIGYWLTTDCTNVHIELFFGKLTPTHKLGLKSPISQQSQKNSNKASLYSQFDKPTWVCFRRIFPIIGLIKLFVIRPVSFPKQKKWREVTRLTGFVTFLIQVYITCYRGPALTPGLTSFYSSSKIQRWICLGE